MNDKDVKTVSIPESVTINGVTYAVKDTPELQKFIQEVAKVEKSKLYTQFENLKSQIANLGKVQITDDKDFDVNTIVEKLKSTFVTKEDFKEMLPGIVKEVVQPVLIATEQNRKNELEQYRENLIRENLSTCIPELVKGETKEELDQSLKESIRLRASYPTPSTANIDHTKHVTDPLIKSQMKEFKEDSAPYSLPQSSAAPQSVKDTSSAPPSAPRRPSPEVTGRSYVKQMPMSEFTKQRDNLKAQLEAMYGGGSI